MDQRNHSKPIIWALGQRTKYAHAYVGEAGITACTPLCGVKHEPSQFLDHFDLENPLIQKIACPDCLARLALVDHIRPITELYKVNHAPMTSTADSANSADRVPKVKC